MVGDYFRYVSNLATAYCLLVTVITSNNHHTPFTVKALIIFMNPGLLVGSVLALWLQPVFDYLFFFNNSTEWGARHNSPELFMFCVLLYRVQSRGGETRRVWQRERKERRRETEKKTKKNKEPEQRNSVCSLGGAVGVEGAARRGGGGEGGEEELGAKHAACGRLELTAAQRPPP